MTRIKIHGMSCAHCVQAVTRALSAIEGIKNLKVDLENSEAVFDMPSQADMDRIKAAVEDAGFKAVLADQT